MYTIGKLKNKLVILLLSFILILIIGVIDYLTSAELTLSVFYLIPISLHALYYGTTKKSIIVNAIFAGLVWAIVIIGNRFYSNIFFTIWNSSVVFAFFLIVGLLLFSLKKRLKEIKEMNETLIKLNAEKNKFIGIAAHDIRTPISSIYSFSDLILTTYAKNLTPELLNIISIIKDTSNSALVLLADLLNISVIESGNIKVNFKMQDYLDFVKRTMYLNQIIADKKRICISLETAEKEIQLMFDEHYLSAVINNLLSNAIKYSYQNSEIKIKVTKTQKNGVLTEFIDNGKGIAEDEQIKLFNYFQKTNTTPTAGEMSTGLGLAIAKKIIQEHGGKIGLKSAIGNGSNFYYELFQK
jgi:signal transduction histidine kinase